ncbi:hypothetical protein ABMA27_001031 [Loxostege sticticalis]|uniref:Peptidoglycan-recognition protein n=1 Tax=Loxostege sticticalis TaxID=481309 RepID=A0ABR3I195_LOXSC
MKLFVAVVVLFASNSLEIVPIAVWGGSDYQHEKKLENPVPFAIIQHTVTEECTTDQECLHLVKELRNFFLTLLDLDIPYSFMIGGNGKVYEGAGWHTVGAHTWRYNDKSIGIGFLGDFRRKSPTPDALKAAQELLSYGFQNKYLADDYKLVGAGQLVPTESPGAALQKIIEGWPHWTPNPLN